MFRRFLLLTLIILVPIADAYCSTELKDESKNIHVVLENCSNIGAFSLGGVYNGKWEKLTYFYPKPWSGTFITVKVDDKLYATSIDPRDGILMDPYITDHPRNVGDEILTAWTLPENILVKQRFKTVENGTLLILEIINNGNRTSVGVRIHMDTMLGENDGAPVYIPGDGLKTSEASYVGSTLNFKYWKAYNKPDEPTIVATGMIAPDRGMSYPDKLVIADWKKSKDTAWDYQTAGRSIVGDSAVILYFNPRVLENSESFNITTGYGNTEQVLPAIKGRFGLTEILTDRVSGNYCPGETSKIMVDVLSSNVSNEGKVRLEVKDDEKILYSKIKPSGVVETDSVRTISFSFLLPNVTESKSFDVTATLLNETDAVIDKITKNSLIKIDINKCKPVERGFNLLWLVLLAGLIILGGVTFFLTKKRRGNVAITKIFKENKAIVTVVNNTNKDITSCIVEDKIPTQAEVDVTTLEVVRQENTLTWNIGTLKAGDSAILEYTVKGVNVLPPARVSWDEGELVSE